MKKTLFFDHPLHDLKHGYLNFFYSLTSVPQPKCSSDLKFGPFSPTRDWGSRVSGLVIVE